MSSFRLLLCLHKLHIGLPCWLIFGVAKAEKGTLAFVLVCVYSTRIYNKENVNFSTSMVTKKNSLFSHSFICVGVSYCITSYIARAAVTRLLLFPFFYCYILILQYFYIVDIKTTVIIQESAVICVFLCQEEILPIIKE